MPGVWFAIRKSMSCKSKSSNLREDSSCNVDPIPRRIEKGSASVGCLANLRHVIHGSIRQNKRPSICGSKVEESRPENSNPVLRNGIVHNQSGVSLRTTSPERIPGFVRHGHLMLLNHESGRLLAESSRKNGGGSTSSVCQICGGKHRRSNAVESHRLHEHAVSELVEGDSSRKIVEMICRTGQRDIDIERTKIEKILKVNNKQNTLARFEDYREIVKTKASKRSNNKENPRCLADGNELLRFHATTILCTFGMNGSSSFCRSISCGACRILRNGFFTRSDFLGRVGIFATSNCDRALRYASDREEAQLKRKALFVCRVIAGKIQNPVRKLEQGFSPGSRFDSLAWKIGRNRNVEELFLLSPRALLPCFVVIYNSSDS